MCLDTAPLIRGGTNSRGKARKRRKPCQRKGKLRARMIEKRQRKLLNGTSIPESSRPGGRMCSDTATHLRPTSTNVGVIKGFTSSTGSGNSASCSLKEDEEDDESKFVLLH